MQESGIEKAIRKICTNYSLKYSKFEIIMAINKNIKERRETAKWPIREYW